MKARLLLLFVFLLFSCTVNKDDARIAANFCNCNNSIMNSGEDLTTKRVKLEDCYFMLLREIDSKSSDSISRDILVGNVAKLIETKCSEFDNFEKLYNHKRSISVDLEKNLFKCREYFIDGEYVPVGINVPIRIIRRGTKNIVKYSDYGCESVFETTWIDDCKYYLIQKSTSCLDQSNMNGDSMLVRVINIKSDTIHYEVDMDSKTFPQIMRRINN